MLILHPVRSILLALALLAVGCEVGDTLTTRAGLTGPDFGDAYEVVVEASLVAAPPRLGIDTLELDVRYGGGCAPHDFRLRTRRDTDTTALWLYHDAHGDACEAFLTERLVVAVPASLLATEHVVLLLPGGGVFTLR